MPYIAPGLLESSVFLYPSEDDARNRANWGGSGVVMGIPMDHYRVHLYAVTNDHVAQQCPVIRLTRSVKRVKEAFVVPGVTTDWESHPKGDDIAIRYLGVWPSRESWYVYHALLLSEDDLDPYAVGPGDDCMMIGRYINRDLQQFDRPVVRFGNLAMSPPEPVYQEERTFWQDSFLVDMRSHSGFSGSPVFAYFQEPGHRQVGPGFPEKMARTEQVSGMMGKTWLLGINWGHLPIWTAVREAESRQVIGQAVVNGGMAAIVPAWKLREMLDDKARRMERDKAEEKLRDVPRGAAVLDVESADEFERFEDLTKKLVAVPKTEIDEKRKDRGK